MLAQTQEFNGETLTAAIAATFKHRHTPLPSEVPRALTSEFSEDAEKQALWRAFLRKGRLDASGKTLAEVADLVQAFLMPPTISALLSNSTLSD